MREPGAAAARHARGAQAALARAPAGHRPRDLLLELHRRADAVQHGRPVLDLRRRAQAAAPRAGAPGLGRDGDPRLRRRRRVGLAVGRAARDRQGPRDALAVALVPHARARASCSSSSARTSPRSADSRWRSARSRSLSSPAIRCGTRSARSASACCWSWSRSSSAIEVKSLLVGQGAEPNRVARMRRASRGATRGRTRAQPDHAADGPRRDGRREGADAADRVEAGLVARRSIASSRAFACTSRRFAGCSSSPTIATETQGVRVAADQPNRSCWPSAGRSAAFETASRRARVARD